ncbi:MAG: L-serine ammonia-lyase [Actinobacteria bacterium]|nr:L-serine ammonia-lyase [Actinomycetota bacterium]
MRFSLTHLFSVGPGPSSSHTIGPMRAAADFAAALIRDSLVERVVRVRVELFGSLAYTGAGHGTMGAVLLGLEGEHPETVEPERAAERVQGILTGTPLRLCGTHEVGFDPETDFVFNRHKGPGPYANMLTLAALDSGGETVIARTYASVGGGFVTDETGRQIAPPPLPDVPLPHPFFTAAELLARARETGLSVSSIVCANECAWRPHQEVDAYLDLVIERMMAAIDRGAVAEGVLPGPLKLPRRAPLLYRRLRHRQDDLVGAPLCVADWVDLYALAVAEENAAGGIVVTAPTGGSSGVLPAVLRYYRRFYQGASSDGERRLLLAAAGICTVFREQTALSGAEIGCQGEIGVAAAMAAAGLTEALGGTPAQVENAAEIATEHSLGLTCDPVAGLVQIPCIERNAMAAVTAINASRLALLSDGSHRVPLDRAIAAMKATGRDMRSKYKETARGGLAVSLPVC